MVQYALWEASLFVMMMIIMSSDLMCTKKLTTTRLSLTHGSRPIGSELAQT